MNEYQNVNIPQEEGEIDIMEYVTKLLKRWKFLLVWACVSAVIALALVIDTPKKYTSTAVLAPEIAQKSSAGGLSSLAAMAGINLNNAVVTDAMYPDLYPEIVGSTPFMVELFSVPVSFVRKGETVNTDLYEYLKEYQKSSWVNKVLGAPMKGLSALLKSKDDEAEGIAKIDALNLTREQGRILDALSRCIGITVDKKTMLITINVTMQDAPIAKQICDEVESRLETYVVKYRTEKSRQDVEYYSMLNEQAKEEYYAAQRKYARYVDSNQGISRQSIRIEQERLQNETNLAFTLYNQTAQQLQMAQAKIQQETPVCAVLKPAAVALRGTPSRAKNLIIITFLLCCVGAAWVLWGDMVKEFFAKLKES